MQSIHVTICVWLDLLWAVLRCRQPIQAAANLHREGD